WASVRAHAHDRALAVRALDLRERRVEGLPSLLLVLLGHLRRRHVPSGRRLRVSESLHVKVGSPNRKRKYPTVCRSSRRNLPCRTGRRNGNPGTSTLASAPRGLTLGREHTTAPRRVTASPPSRKPERAVAALHGLPRDHEQAQHRADAPPLRQPR